MTDFVPVARIWRQPSVTRSGFNSVIVAFFYNTIIPSGLENVENPVKRLTFKSQRNDIIIENPGNRRMDDSIAETRLYRQ